jgi:hypothetical protein
MERNATVYKLGTNVIKEKKQFSSMQRKNGKKC